MKKAGQSIARMACINRYIEYGVNSRHTNVRSNSPETHKKIWTRIN